MTPFNRRASGLTFGALTILAAAACGDSGSGPDKGAAGGDGDSSLRLVAGANSSDTILATRSQGLVVEVRDDEGLPRSGIVVRYESGPTADSARRFERGMLVCPVTALECGGQGGMYGSGPYFVADSTDARGRSVVQVRHGTVAGPTWIVVTVPEFGIRDSFPFTTRPGAAARVIATPRDTAVQVGSAFTLGGAVVDRFGNARTTDAVTMTAGPNVTVSSGRVSGASLGRGHVLLSAGTRVDTAYVSVVPAGRLAAVQGENLVVANFDGAERRVMELSYNEGLGLRPAWIPGTTRLVVHTSDGSRIGLHEVNEQAGTWRPLAASTTLAQELFPTVTSANGGRVYYSGNTGGTYELWRMQLDGTNAVRVLAAPMYSGYFRPAVSPDGTRIAAVVLNGGGVSGVAVQVFDAASGVAIGSPVANAHSPRFSPDGQWIAMGTAYGGALRIMRANATDVRIVTTRGYGEWVDWTADGQWLVGTAGATQSLELVRVSNGEALPIRWGAGMYQPAVKR